MVININLPEGMRELSGPEVLCSSRQDISMSVGPSNSAACTTIVQKLSAARFVQTKCK